jgi:hypothetical protein
MESFLTQATVVAELVSVGYVVSSFASYAHRRINQPNRWRSQAPTPAVKDAPANPQPSSRKPTPVELLRQQCQKAGIKWRNAHGKNKHLKKAEMIAALQRLEQTQRVAEPQRQYVQAAVTHQHAA